MKRLIFLLFPCLLGACGTISGNPLADVGGILPGDASGRFATDITSAQYNLEQGMQVGALSKDDPALGCLTNVANDLGVGKDSQIASFTPKRDGIVSEGSILYIRAQQIKKLTAGGQNIVLPKDCLALVGQLTIDAARAGLKVGSGLLPGGGLLQGILPGIGSAAPVRAPTRQSVVRAPLPGEAGY